MDLTELLRRADAGDADARGDAIRAAYNELRRLAAAQMNNERVNHTLTSTALVHEVAIRLLDGDHAQPQDRSQFFAIAARAMRNYLIDYARSHGRQKRGGDRKKLTLEEALVACREQRDDLLTLNDALEELGALDERKMQVVEMRYFAGMSNEEIATALNVSLATVKRDWTVARAWLLEALSAD